MRLCERADCGDQDGFMQIMKDAAAHYGRTHDALERSDRLINSRIKDKVGDT